VVTRPLAGGDDTEVDIADLTPGSGERFMLCYDGLFGVVTNDRIAAILGDRGAALQDVCNRLVAAANSGGGPDNITTVVIQVDAA
jgi:protein phosphatase